MCPKSGLLPTWGQRDAVTAGSCPFYDFQETGPDAASAECYCFEYKHQTQVPAVPESGLTVGSSTLTPITRPTVGKKPCSSLWRHCPSLPHTPGKRSFSPITSEGMVMIFRGVKQNGFWNSGVGMALKKIRETMECRCHCDLAKTQHLWWPWTMMLLLQWTAWSPWVPGGHFCFLNTLLGLGCGSPAESMMSSGFAWNSAPGSPSRAWPRSPSRG